MARISTLIKRFTLWELLKGLGLTGRYFFKEKKTLQYPEEQTPKSARFRGVPVLRRYPNGEERCIDCKLCEVACPALAITIEGAVREDGSRRTTRYDIDAFKCIYCGFCEEACPVDAVVLSDELNFTVHERGKNILTKDKLLAMGEAYERRIVENKTEDSEYR